MKALTALITVTLGLGSASAQDRLVEGGGHIVSDEPIAHHRNHHAGSDEVINSVTIEQTGQAAFAAIQEVVAVLMADPDTDWRKVDIEALRQHLIDMNNVTMHAIVESQPIDGGARFTVSSTSMAIRSSIQSMVLAHVKTMDGSDGLHMTAEKTQNGMELEVTGDQQRIRGLGFIGILTDGMHHQAHHLAMAKGQNPHPH